MKKLHEMKKWMTLEDTAKYLSTVLNEPVCEADILRLGLDSELVLSVYFVNQATARTAKYKPKRENHELIELSRQLGKPLSEKELDTLGLVLEDDITSLIGVWDFPMIGGERIDIEHRYQMLTNGVSVELTCLDGVFVTKHDGTFFQLLTHFDENPYANSDAQKQVRKAYPLYHLNNYYPSGGIPDDAVLVVRMSELRKFEHRLCEVENPNEKPLTTTERDTLLVIIAALCKGIKQEHHAKGAAGFIVKLTQDLGAPVSENTIGTALKKIPEALERRGK